MTITTAHLLRWTGLAALIAGVTFAGIQPIHPPDVLASVTTSAWAIITPIKTVMAMLFLIGITGLYARQLHKVGWLGLTGYLLLSVFWALQTALIFAETVLIPPLASVAPAFVEGFLGLVNGHPTGIDLGALPAVWALTGIVYVLGGLLFGIATFRAGILPRWASGLLAAASVLTPLAALLPHAIQRFAAVPVGVALAAMGYALWSERREDSPETLSGTATRPLRPT
ncbi:hypothetical protein [Deinococcus ruber]|uniref:DUF4386 domain-containing protein n=1 Tax=Deinococcus ruber TaxID=1848197 RepID=A0A918FEF4_9DEIO|nr:hypothetical protein [Deinococcus ruber]GGR28185.1 hypothetical protein GCM10008957_44260 [Deinococcus ruber]